MILDSFLLFTGSSAGASGGIVSTNTLDAPTTGTQIASNIVDLGVTNSIPSSANGGGARDIGVGGNPVLWVWANVAVAFVGGSTLQLLLAGAPDNGSAAPGSYTTMWTSPAYAVADLDIGAQLANVSVPRVTPAQVLPRFLRLSFIAGGTHTLGKVGAGIVLDRFDQIQGVDSILSGYPAGLTVAN